MATWISLEGSELGAILGCKKPRRTLLITESPCQRNVKISKGTSNATSHLKSRGRISRAGRRKLFVGIGTDINAFTSFLIDHVRHKRIAASRQDLHLIGRTLSKQTRWTENQDQNQNAKDNGWGP